MYGKTIYTPPTAILPIIQKLMVAYKLWHSYWIRFPKHVRFNIGSNIDALLLGTAGHVFTASHTGGQEKLEHLEKASEQFDLSKFLLHVSWDIGALNDKQYIALSEKLTEIGRMLGGWQKQTKAPRPGPLNK